MSKKLIEFLVHFYDFSYIIMPIFMQKYVIFTKFIFCINLKQK